MAVDFNGTTSKLAHTTASGYNTDTLTICGWVRADGVGEASRGFVVQFPDASADNASPVFYHHSTASVLRFLYDFTTTDGIWSLSATDGQWNAVAISYDRTSTANDPVARVNFSSASVTRTTGPVGTPVSPATGYCIGNSTNQVRTWDGALQHLQFFNVVLTAAEMDAALRAPGSVRRGLVSWWPMWHATYDADLVNTAFQPTATDLGTRDGAPLAVPWGFGRRRRAYRVASGTTFTTGPHAAVAIGVAASVVHVVYGVVAAAVALGSAVGDVLFIDGPDVVIRKTKTFLNLWRSHFHR